MSDTINLEIVSSTDVPFSVGIQELYIPAYLGEAGVLENHKPYISLLQPGEVYYKDVAQGKNHYLYVREGFIEVKGNNVVLISDTVEKAEALNKEEIESKLADIGTQIQFLTGRDMTDEEMTQAPKKLKKAIAEEKEFKIKLAIVNKQATNK